MPVAILPTNTVTPRVVRSIEPMDLQEFLLRYARAIVEVHGAGPSQTGPQLVSSTASTPAA